MIAIKIDIHRNPISNCLIEHNNQSKLMGLEFGGTHLPATKVYERLFSKLSNQVDIAVIRRVSTFRKDKFFKKGASKYQLPNVSLI